MVLSHQAIFRHTPFPPYPNLSILHRGMLTLDLSVTVQALLPQQKQGALGLAAGMKKSKMTASGSAVLSGQKSGAGNGSSERELQTSASTGATRLTAENVGSVHT